MLLLILLFEKNMMWNQIIGWWFFFSWLVTSLFIIILIKPFVIWKKKYDVKPNYWMVFFFLGWLVTSHLLLLLTISHVSIFHLSLTSHEIWLIYIYFKEIQLGLCCITCLITLKWTFVIQFIKLHDLCI